MRCPVQLHQPSHSVPPVSPAPYTWSRTRSPTSYIVLSCYVHAYPTQPKLLLHRTARFPRNEPVLRPLAPFAVSEMSPIQSAGHVTGPCYPVSHPCQCQNLLEFKCSEATHLPTPFMWTELRQPLGRFRPTISTLRGKIPEISENGPFLTAGGGVKHRVDANDAGWFVPVIPKVSQKAKPSRFADPPLLAVPTGF